MEDQRGGLARWFLLYGDTVYLTAAGLLLLAASWGAISKGSDAAAASFAVLSGGALLVAPFASRLHGVLRIGPIGMSLREKVIVAAAVAPSRSLEGVLPLLVSNDISVERLSLPSSLAGRALTDPELEFIRQELNLSVLAIQIPGEDRWRAGGQISGQRLPEGTSLLVAGSGDSLRRFKERMEMLEETTGRRAENA